MNKYSGFINVGMACIAIFLHLEQGTRNRLHKIAGKPDIAERSFTKAKPLVMSSLVMLVLPIIPDFSVFFTSLQSVL